MKLDIPIKKVKYQGADIFVPIRDTSDIPYDIIFNAEVKSIPDKRLRSYEQLCLYWTLCGIVAENTDDENWNTKEKADEQCKIACKHYDFWTYYENAKTGEKMLNIRTSSISFANLSHIDACGYFTMAFNVLAAKIGLTVDELVGEAERQGKKLKIPEYQMPGEEVEEAPEIDGTFDSHTD